MLEAATGQRGVVVEIWAAEAIAAGSGTTITVTLNSSVTSICSAAQYSGVGAIFATNGQGGGSASTANPTFTRTTLDTNNSIVAMYGVSNGTASTAASGTNLRESVSISGAPAMAAALAWRWAYEFTTSARAATFAWAAVALTAPYLFNSFTVYPEIPGALAVMVICPLPGVRVTGEIAPPRCPREVQNLY